LRFQKSKNLQIYLDKKYLRIFKKQTGHKDIS
jgi:hypothetical protein